MTAALYDEPRFRALCGGALRPGGLALTRAMLSAAALQAGASVLDIGCGDGESLALLASRGFAAAGVDASPEAAARAQARCPAADVHLGDARRLPAADGSYAACLCECVLSPLEHPEAVLGEIRRVLAPGGRLLLSDFAAPFSSLGQSIPALLRLMNSLGFKGLILCDAAPALRSFTARVVWEYGAWESVLGRAYPHGCAAAGATRYLWGVWEARGSRETRGA